jgi:hypothetical protein
MVNATILSLANSYADAGISTIPIRCDGSKSPANTIPLDDNGDPTWKPFQKEIAGPDERQSLFCRREVGIATVNGAVSGNLETVDFDDIPSFQSWKELMIDQGARELYDRLLKFQTPRPGVQIQYRCYDGIGGSTKLARRLKDGEIKVLIETKGEGGYNLVPGCPPECHETGRPYKLRGGDPFNPPVITAEERKLIFDISRSLNEYVEPEFEHKPAPPPSGSNGHRPGDEYNQRTTWSEILEPLGWKLIRTKGESELWRRPGKNKGISATTNYAGSGLIYNFSSSVQFFETEHTYSKFAAYARIYHRGDYQAAAKDLASKGFGEQNPPTHVYIGNGDRPLPKAEGWQLWSATSAESWPVETLHWIVEGLIPKGGLGFISAPPKDRKSLLILDLSIHLAQNAEHNNHHLWLDKYPVEPAKVLYIAREDPRRRIRERMMEMCQSYQIPLPQDDRLQFLIRDRIALTEPSHVAWLKEQITQQGFEVLVLDVLNRMIPDLDEMSAKDMARMVSILEELNRDTDITIQSIDHTRKPLNQKGATRDDQTPNPFDLKGSVAKYGCADFMICLARTTEPHRMQCYVENKDTDDRPLFFIDVSAKDSGKPKFTWAGSINQLADDRIVQGLENRDRVYACFGDDWMLSKDIANLLKMSRQTVNKHIADLIKLGKIQKAGSGKDIHYGRVLIGEFISTQQHNNKSNEDN